MTRKTPLRFLLFISVLFTSLADGSQELLWEPQRVTNLPLVPNRFIVEVSSSDDLGFISGGGAFNNVTAFLHNSLAATNVGFVTHKELNAPGLFVGAVITLNDPSLVQNLVNTSGIVAIRPVKAFSVPTLASSHIVNGEGDPDVPLDTQSTHAMTGVDNLHEEGILGAGIKIGIIDTGIDYTHPLLGAAFGPGHKVAGGYDLVGDDYDGTNDPVPDPDPLDQCFGHGTHVAGIIGANPGSIWNISGVAYESTLYSYRVFGCHGGTTTDDVMVDAMLRSINDGVDIINLSIGGTDGWTESTASIVASRIAASGKIVTIAAGNDGLIGPWYSSSPSNGVDVISVASVDNVKLFIENATVHGAEYTPISYFRTFPFNAEGDLPVYPTSLNTSILDDACAPLPEDTPDLSSYLVLIRRGTCTFVQKLDNAAAKGMKLALIYDNGTAFNMISTGIYNAALIRAADGEFLVKQVAAGVNLSLSFPQDTPVEIPDPQGGLTSAFSSYGPSNDFYFKPSIAAPGGNIMSTYPVRFGSYLIASGTSMAAPFLAGVSSLLLSVKGKDKEVATSAQALFETTSKYLVSNKTEGSPFQTVSQQGAGLIDAYSAIHSTVVVSPGEFILNDTTHSQYSHTFTVTNSGEETQLFDIKHVPAGTALTVKPDSIFVVNGTVPLSKKYASVDLSATSISVSPGASEEIAVLFKPPADLDPAMFPVYSGFIEISNAKEAHHVTYLGLAASLKDKQVLDTTDMFFGVKIPAIIDDEGEVQKEERNYTFVDGDWPTLYWRLAFGTPLLLIDLVDAQYNITQSEALERRGDIDPVFTLPPNSDTVSSTSIQTIGSLLQSTYIPRNAIADVTNTTTFYSLALSEAVFANGTDIPEGLYRLLLRALRVTGSPNDEKDWENWLSPVVGVRRS